MLQSHENTIPDLVDPIEGWRGWRVSEDGTFHSPDRGTPWKGGQLTWEGNCECGVKVNSRIIRGTSWLLNAAAKVVESEVPPVIESSLAAAAQKIDNQCHCGINAFATELQVQVSTYFDRCQAIGSVHLTGEVRKFKLGWRAERAQVARVWATREAYADIVRAAAEKAGASYEGVATVDEGERAAARAAQAMQVLKLVGTVMAVEAALLTVAGTLSDQADKRADDKARAEREAKRSDAGDDDPEPGSAQR